MRVVDWQKWTRFKAIFAGVLLFLGLGLALGLERTESTTWGFISLVMVMWGSFILVRIQQDS